MDKNILELLPSIGDLAHIQVAVFDGADLLYTNRTNSSAAEQLTISEVPSHLGPQLLTGAVPFLYLLHDVNEIRCLFGPFMLNEDNSARNTALPTVSVEAVMAVLRLAHCLITGRNEPFAALEQELRQMKDKKSRMIPQAARQAYRLDRSEQKKRRMPYAVQEMLFHALRNSDLDRMRQLAADYSGIKIGAFHGTAFQKEEYASVIGISLMCEAAIEAGVVHFKAHEIQEMLLERLARSHTIEQVKELRYTAMATFMDAIRNDQAQAVRSIPLERAKTYVQNHLNSDLNLDNVAAAAGIGKRQLTNLFRQHESMTLMDFVWTERVCAACNELCFTGKSISQIAAYFYFSSPSHFAARFKRYTGQSPSAWRKQHYRAEVL